MIFLIICSVNLDSLNYVVSILILYKLLKIDPGIFQELIKEPGLLIHIDVKAESFLDESWAFLVDWALKRLILYDIKGEKCSVNLVNHLSPIVELTLSSLAFGSWNLLGALAGHKEHRMDLLKELFLWFWNCGIFLFLWVLVGVLLGLSLLSRVQVVLHLLEFLSSFLELTDRLFSLLLNLWDIEISSSLSRHLTAFLWTILIIRLWLNSIILFILLSMVSLIGNSFLVEIVLDVNPLVVAYWVSCLLSWCLELHRHWHWLEVSLLHGHAIDIWVGLHLLLLETQLFLELSDKESLSLLVQQ